MKHVFILSTGRTGTTFLGDLFSKYPKVYSCHEPKPSRVLRIVSNLYYEGLIGDKSLKSIFRMSRRNKLESLSKSYDVYLESNPFIYAFIHVLPEVADDTTIIHVVRDPRTYVSSYLNHGVFKGVKLLAKKFLPYWFMKVNKHIRPGEKLSPYDELAGRWYLINKYLLEKGRGMKNYHLVRYEDIFSKENDDAMKRVCEIAGLPFDPELVKKGKGTRINEGKLKEGVHWKEWDSTTAKSFVSICGELMEEFGYGQEADWKAKVF